MKPQLRPRAAVVGRLAILMSAAIWQVGLIVASGGLSEDRPPDYWYQFFVLSLVLAIPWMAAVLLLRRAWWAETVLRPPSTMDPPARLPAAAGATGALILIGFAVGEVTSPMGVFALTFVGLFGVAAVVTVARSRSWPKPTSGPAVLATGTAGVASCIAATAYLVDQYPTAALRMHGPVAILLAVILVGALWLVLAPPRLLAGDRLARPVAAGVALVLGLGLLLSSRADLRGSGVGIAGYVFFVPIAAIFVYRVAGRRRAAVDMGRRSGHGMDRRPHLAGDLRRRDGRGRPLVPGRYQSDSRRRRSPARRRRREHTELHLPAGPASPLLDALRGVRRRPRSRVPRPSGASRIALGSAPIRNRRRRNGLSTSNPCQLRPSRFRWVRTFARFPQRSIEHHRRAPGRDWSTNNRPQSAASQTRMRCANGPPKRSIASRARTESACEIDTGEIVAATSAPVRNGIEGCRLAGRVDDVAISWVEGLSGDQASRAVPDRPADGHDVGELRSSVVTVSMSRTTASHLVTSPRLCNSSNAASGPSPPVWPKSRHGRPLRNRRASCGLSPCNRAM